MHDGRAHDIQLVAASLERVRRRAAHVVKLFYAHLFHHHPHLRSLFPTAMGDQYERLFAALVQVVGHLDHPGLGIHLERLGRDHRKFGVVDADYAAVGESLIAAIRQHSPASWDERTELAWRRMYAVTADAMMSGAHRSEAENEPPCWEATVVSHRLHGNHTAIIRAEVRSPYPWLPGQYATVQHRELPGVWRPYSLSVISGSTAHHQLLEFHVGRVKGGLLSTLLCDHTVPGQVLRLGAASGAALAPPPGTPTVTLIAAGTGWGPVKSVLHELLDRRPAPRVRIDAVARGEAHFYDGAALDDLLRDHPCLSAYWWYQERGEGEMRAAERLHTHLRARRDWPDESVYLCGPVMFVEETAQLLFECGLPEGSLIRDPQPLSIQPREHVSHAEAFLDPVPVKWIDPQARTGPLDGARVSPKTGAALSPADPAAHGAGAVQPGPGHLRTRSG